MSASTSNLYGTHTKNMDSAYEATLKRDLIDFLLKQYSERNISLATEVPFCGYRRRADLIFINGSSNAFEIKTAKDSLTKLKNQINDYNKVFDYVYAVVDQVHLKKAKACLPQRVGLILYSNGVLTKIRIPEQNKRKNKYMLSYFVDRDKMLALLRARKVNLHRKSEIHTIRSAVAKNIPASLLNSVATSCIKEKYKKGSEEFLNFRGTISAIDDVMVLGPISRETLMSSNP